MGVKAKSAVRALIEALEDKDAHVRAISATTLGSIGPQSASAVPAWKGLLKDKYGGARKEAILALDKIDPVQLRQNVAAWTTALAVLSGGIEPGPKPRKRR